MIKLYDIYEVRPEKRYADLNKRQRHRLMDSVLNHQDEKRRGLLVDFNLSNSGRVINHRLYMPKAQQLAAGRLADKPIIKNHDQSDVDNIIGRFVGGRWNPLDNEALQFFTNMQDFMALKRAFDSNDPKRIHRIMSKFGLLTNDQWLGLGEIEAQARITDEQSIEKFLKGEYLHFSAGAHTNRWACGLCGSDWAQDGMCEHTPGKVYDEGLAIIVTGDEYEVDEASVIVTPGNKPSRVRSMRMSDSAGNDIAFPEEVIAHDDQVIYVTDALILGDEMEPQIEDLVAALLPVLLDKLKAELHSATDGADKTDTQDGDQGQTVEDTSTTEGTATKQEEEGAAATDAEAGQGNQEVQDEESAQDEQVVIPWTLLDFALRGATGVSRTDEEIAALDAKFVLGPDNKFVVDSVAAVQAARDVLANFEKPIVDALEPKLVELERSFMTVDIAAHDQLKTDYANALLQIQDLRSEIDKLKNRIAELDKGSVTDDNVADVGNHKKRTEDIARVEDNTVASTEETPTHVKLSDFERKIIDRYKEIYDTRGEVAAKNFLDSKIRKRHLPRTFDINQYLEEN